ncbi:MAG: hypothetical protein P3M75_00160 [Candidatus Hodgkinia cicadicola]|nr:MAG: hypothetical protein P3M75_00160 [Candidatus Hodgkinia cicadicola]
MQHKLLDSNQKALASVAIKRPSTRARFSSPKTPSVQTHYLIHVESEKSSSAANTELTLHLSNIKRSSAKLWDNTFICSAVLNTSFQFGLTAYICISTEAEPNSFKAKRNLLNKALTAASC